MLVNTLQCTGRLPPQRIIQAQMSVVLRLRNPALESNFPLEIPCCGWLEQERLSKWSVPSILCTSGSMKPNEGEGQAQHHWNEPRIDTGCPILGRDESSNNWAANHRAGGEGGQQQSSAKGDEPICQGSTGWASHPEVPPHPFPPTRTLASLSRSWQRKLAVSLKGGN